jgi:hypothetical protein
MLFARDQVAFEDNLRVADHPSRILATEALAMRSEMWVATFRWREKFAGECGWHATLPG